MRLLAEIFEKAEAGARFTVAEYGGAYFEGVKSVGEFSPERILLYFSKSGVELEGEELRIETYVDGDMRIGGRIDVVRLKRGG